jgi:hypothetical protein
MESIGRRRISVGLYLADNRFYGLVKQAQHLAYRPPAQFLDLCRVERRQDGRGLG